ncbi:hypothetical protein ABZY83_11645 [Streptomyces virginiae]|uniref:hypothetical protein n=1 Tax=Streptomyces TaxID=1883 RepID=UPI0006AEF342|nr:MULTISPECIES: hypothetical protein [unclassified Streptomyces]KOU62322.1 hypothetical protein ADK96_26955 [Streptomyces sp. IGB124]KOU70368.1 hypothetical protein ADK61_34450 [Streptomyces sp. XY66]KOV29900.1 hypothetical protein ADK97_30580 [Streptomyces sp. H021]
MSALDEATEAVYRYRRPEPWCWEVVVKAVCGDAHTSWAADHAVFQADGAVAAHADLIAESLGHGSAYTDRLLTLALAGMGDLRALPALQRVADDNRLPSDRPRARILAVLPAAELLPVVLPVLRQNPEQHDSTTALLELLALWGQASEPAVSEMIRFLGTADTYDALRVLGRIGPPAAAAADRLAAYATGRDPGARRPHTRVAAWAHWKVTGDPTLALDVCGTAVRSGTASHGLPFLADLGPLAAAHADAVRRLMESPGAWTRTYAAHAYWRITGDPGPAIPVLLAEADPAWAGDPAMPVREAVRILGKIGAPAVSAAPLLRRILAQEERLSRPWRGVRILADQAYVRTLTEALEGIDGK